MLLKGCEVVNLKAPEWGVGTVLCQESERRIRVHFDHAGEKLLDLNHAQLNSVGTAIGPALEVGKRHHAQTVIETIGTFPLKYE